MKTCDYNHLILYAKSKYEEGDVIEDVKRILCARTGNERCSDKDMWMMVTRALFRYAPSRRNLEQFVQQLFRPEWDEPDMQFVWFTDNVPLRRAVRKVLAILRDIRVFDDDGDDVLGLGKPDPNILPLKNKGKTK